MIRHCPRCELRFVTEGELREHLAVDHGAAGEALEPYRYPVGRHAQQPLYRDLRDEPAERAHRYLLVANQSLGGEALARRIGELVAEQPAAAFYVVVPATHSADYVAREALEPVAGAAAGPGAGSRRGTDERGQEQARWRLRGAVGFLRGLGVEARGEVGPPDPLEAVEQALAREPADEVIVSTLPSALSRWLAADVPKLLARRFGLPVTTVVAEQQPAHDA